MTNWERVHEVARTTKENEKGAPGWSTEAKVGQAIVAEILRQKERKK